MDASSKSEMVLGRHLKLSTGDSYTGVIVPLPALRSCYARLMGPPSEALWAKTQTHFCRVLMLQRLEVFENESWRQVPFKANKPKSLLPVGSCTNSMEIDTSQIYLGWVGDCIDQSDAALIQNAATVAASRGCLTLDDVVYLGISALLCEILGIRAGERVIVSAVDLTTFQALCHDATDDLLNKTTLCQFGWPVCKSLELCPLRLEDWDTIQLHANDVEEQLLQQVALVMPSQVIPLWIGSGVKPIFFKVCKADFKGRGVCAGATRVDAESRGSSIVSPAEPICHTLRWEAIPFVLLERSTEIHVRPLKDPCVHSVREVFDYASAAKESCCTSEYRETNWCMNLRVLPLQHEVEASNLVKTMNCRSAMRPAEFTEDGAEGKCSSTSGKYERENLHHSDMLVSCSSSVSSVLRRPFQCLIHPTLLAVLRDEQKHLVPGLQRMWWNEDLSAVGTDVLFDEDLLTLVVVSLDPHFSSCHSSISTDSVLLFAIPHSGTPLGYIRIPQQLRHLYGWMVSMPVRIKPCLKLPILPQKLVFTPIFCQQHSEMLCREDSDTGVLPMNARDLQTFLQSPSGRQSIVDYLTDLASVEVPWGSTSSESVGRRLIPMILWDGAVLHLRIKVTKADLHSHHNLNSTEQKKFVDSFACGSEGILCETGLQRELAALESELGGLYLLPDDEMTEEDVCGLNAVHFGAQQVACTTQPNAKASNPFGALLKRFTPVDELEMLRNGGYNKMLDDGDSSPSNHQGTEVHCATELSSKTEHHGMRTTHKLPSTAAGGTVSHTNEPTIDLQICVMVSLSAHDDAEGGGAPLVTETGAILKDLFQGTADVPPGSNNLGNSSIREMSAKGIGKNYFVMGASFGKMCREGRIAVAVNSPHCICKPPDDGRALCGPAGRFMLVPFEGAKLPHSLIRSVTQKPTEPLSVPVRSSIGHAGTKGSPLCDMADAETILAMPHMWWLAPPVLLSRKRQSQGISVTSHTTASNSSDLQLLEMLEGCVQIPSEERIDTALCSLCCPQLQAAYANPLALSDFLDVKAFKDSSEKILRAVLRRLLPNCNLLASHVKAADPKAEFSLNTVEPGVILVRGSRGCGKSSFCYGLCAHIQERLGVFTLLIKCRLLARENIPSSLIRRALSVIICAAVLHKPSIVVLDDLDVLCPATEERGDPSSIADVRGAHFAEFLREVLRDAMQHQVVPNTCALNHENRKGAPCALSDSVVIIATAEDVGNLHPVLAQPVLFGSSVFSFHLEFSDISVHTELILKVLDRICKLREDGKRIFLDPHVFETGELHEVSRKLEGYSLADIYAVITRALAEAVFEHATNKTCSALVENYDIILGIRHFQKGLIDAIPRNVRQANFIRPQQRLKDVGALRQPKMDITDMLFLKRLYPSLVRASGIAVHQGIALVGPPGCGKTHLALAAIGESGLRCIHVKGPELLGKYIGSSESAVRTVFKRAQKAKPCAILFDEIEALASKRGGDTTGVTDRVVNQMLCYLDGIESREEVYVVATTSRPDLVDTALLRPGRLDKVCLCGLPASDGERREILRVCLLAANVSLEELDLERLAKQIPPSFTSADIQAAVNHAQILAIQEALSLSPCSSTLQPSTTKPLLLSSHHIEAALRNSRPSLSTQEILQYHRYCRGFLGPAYQGELDTVEKFLLPVATSVTEVAAHSQVVRFRSKKGNSASDKRGKGIAPVTCTTKHDADFCVSTSSDPKGCELAADPCVSEGGTSEDSTGDQLRRMAKECATGQQSEELLQDQTDNPHSRSESRQRWHQEQPGQRVALA